MMMVVAVVGVPVMAAGVETKEQLEILEWESRESAQGDFFAEAMTPALLGPLLAFDYKKPTA